MYTVGKVEAENCYKVNIDLKYSEENRDFCSNLQCLDCSTLGIRTYGKSYPRNQHHFRTEDHYTKILPELAKLLNIPFNPSDFKWKVLEDYGESIPYLYPYKSAEYVFQHKESGEGQLTALMGSYDILQNFERPDRLVFDTNSVYHCIFRGAHICCRILNETIESNKSIVISGDSHMIPLVPVLCQYYKLVIALDNRGKNSYIDWFNGYFTDLLLLTTDSSVAANKHGKNLTI